MSKNFIDIIMIISIVYMALYTSFMLIVCIIRLVHKLSNYFSKKKEYEYWYFTCMDKHMSMLTSEESEFGGEIEIYSSIELALTFMHPADTKLVELAIPEEMLDELQDYDLVGQLKWDDNSHDLIADVLTIKEAIEEIERQ